MILTDEDIIEYQGLVKKRLGLDISKEKALEDALSLIQFVRLAYKIPNNEKLDKEGDENMHKL